MSRLAGLGALAMLLSSCQPRAIRDVCSPLGYAAVDAVCLEMVAPAVARQCGQTPPEDCPEAIAAVATCEMVRAEQERSCR